MKYEYRYRDVELTNPSGLRSLVGRFREHCGGPVRAFIRPSVRRGDETYEFESLDQMLRSPLLAGANELTAWVVGPAKEELHVGLYPQGTVVVSAGGMDEDTATALVRSAAEDLGLEPVPVQPRPDRSAFVAHSFDDAGKVVAGVVSDLLGLVGFRVVTGEAYSPRGVSSKIKDRIREQGVAVCVLTRRRGVDAERRRTSQWVLDEATVAEALDKPVFLLIEKGVEAEIGIHGDKEYIPFTMRSLQGPMVKLLQGLRELGYEFAPEE
jgi:hypothetical protein